MKKKEVTIGIVVLVVFISFLAGIFFLKNESIFSPRMEYYGVYNRVNGLNVDNPVLINGLKVGKVSEIGFLHNSTDIYVKIEMLKNIPLPDNTSMMIVSADLLGSKSIELIMGNSSTFYKSGDTLNTGITKTLQEEVSMQVLPIKKKAEMLISSFDSLIGSLQLILNEKTQENLRKSIESIRFTIDNIQNATSNVDTLIKTEKKRIIAIVENMESITTNIKSNNKKLTNIINNFSSISDTLAKANFAQTLNQVNQSLKDVSQITEKINNGKGSLGMLINNDTLYKNLEASSKSLDNLLLDIKKNPKRYVNFSVFGNKK